MLRWLNRAPEEFVGRRRSQYGRGTRLPEVPAGKVLRFDTKKLHAALDRERVARATSWKQIAAEIGVGVSVLTRLSAGGRTAFPYVMRITRWLGKPVAPFTRFADT
jgi:hypothetical protein